MSDFVGTLTYYATDLQDYTDTLTAAITHPKLSNVVDNEEALTITYDIDTR